MNSKIRMLTGGIATLANNLAVTSSDSSVWARWLQNQIANVVKTNLILAFILLIPAVILADEVSWLEIDGKVYGARPDNRGPIGGADGYSQVVTQGDFTATSVETLIESLTEAKAGQTVFIPGTAEIDLTTHIYIEQLVIDIPSGVTLASDRGHNGSLGAIADQRCTQDA